MMVKNWTDGGESTDWQIGVDHDAVNQIDHDGIDYELCYARMGPIILVKKYKLGRS